MRIGLLQIEEYAVICGTFFIIKIYYNICIFKITAEVELSMPEYDVGTVVVKRCRRALPDNKDCNCCLLLTQMDGLVDEMGNGGSNKKAQVWVNVHGEPGVILQIFDYRRCVLQYLLKDEFNIVTTWRSPATSLRLATILTHKDEFVQHHPNGLILPIDSLIQAVAANRLSDNECDSEIRTREATLFYE